MKFDTENKTVKIFYEQPALKKYGTMKQLTSSSNGSAGDALGGVADPNNRVVNNNTFGGDLVPFFDTSTDPVVTEPVNNNTNLLDPARTANESTRPGGDF
jgi:hypothetical protein